MTNAYVPGYSIGQAIRNRAYRRFIREVKIRNRVRERMFTVRQHDPSPDYWLRPDVMGSLAKTTKRCGGYCCRSCAGPSMQELKHIDPEFVRVVNEEYWNIL